MRIYFDNVEINQDYYAGLTRNCSLFDESFKLGVTMCDTYKLTINNDYGINNIPNEVKINDKILYVDSYKINDFTTEIDLVDKMVDLNFNYDASPLIEASETKKVTLLDIFNDICKQAGIKTDITAFNMSSLEVSYYDNTVSARDYIGYMAELDGSYVYIDENNKLSFKKFNNSNGKEITFDEISDYKIGNSFQYTRVLFDNGTEIYDTGKTETGMTYYVSTDNVYCTSLEAVQGILEAIQGIEFYNFSSTNCPIENENGDLVYIIDGKNKYRTIFQFDGDLNFSGNDWLGGIKLNINNKKQEETEVINNETKIKAIKIKVDRNTNEIEQTIIETNKIQDNLNKNYYDITKTNELIQNANKGLTNTFSEAGGNNIFRNTGLWFAQSDEENPYEYWTGKVERISNNKSANSNAMLIKKGTLTQDEKVPNGKYTASFKYKKLIELADCKVKINDITYDLTEITDTEFVTGETNNEGEYITQPLNIDNNHIEISFISDTDNAIEIYDLMVNAGSVKLAYSQNQNETTTDTVNISKGITISSSNIETQFKANADGIRTINKNGEVLSEFTDKGMKNKQMEITDEAQIVNVLIQNVNEQTWFTRL